MLNLYDYLTPLDNKRLENYISTYGIKKEDYCGNEEYLRYWKKCKPRLFHLLGGNLVYKFPFCAKKDDELIKKELISFYFSTPFISKYLKSLGKTIQTPHHTNEGDKIIVSTSEEIALRGLVEKEVLLSNETLSLIKIKPEGFKKTLQLQKGMKPMRAIQKVIDYFQLEDLKESFEEFRIEHSRIYNEKELKGNMCISINPIDYLTMSDNNSNWSSCMSWVSDGCYHTGTVEMMNSNNVVCCYLEAAEPYYFGKNSEKTEDWQCSNKKWRQLFYVTNEIIVGGKAYPYQNLDCTMAVLNKLKELAEINLKRTYSFGPEPYQDMKHIGSNARMIRNRAWIETGDATKHNIIFDTKGMYNDMFNDHDSSTTYYCYRNKVKKNTIISISGKTVCACCGDVDIIRPTSVLDDEDNYEGAYNERYCDVGQVLCTPCLEKYRCSCCGRDLPTINLYTHKDKQYCEKCINDSLKICPRCGDPFNPITYFYHDDFVARVEEGEIFQQDFYANFEGSTKIKKIMVCYDCEKELQEEPSLFSKKKPRVDPARKSYSWCVDSRYYITNDVVDKDDPEWNKFFLENLKSLRDFLEPDLKK